MAEVLVVRHAESTWNAQYRWSGQQDPPLTPAGRDAARRLARELEGQEFDAIASSDLQRAAETADTLAAALDLPTPMRIVELRERDMGIWTGLTHEEIDRGWPGWRERWREEELLELPGAEHRDAFDDRVRSALIEIAHDRRPEDRLIVVGHAGTLRALGRHLGTVDEHPNLARVWIVVEGGSIRQR